MVKNVPWHHLTDVREDSRYDIYNLEVRDHFRLYGRTCTFVCHNTEPKVQVIRGIWHPDFIVQIFEKSILSLCDMCGSRVIVCGLCLAKLIWWGPYKAIVRRRRKNGDGDHSTNGWGRDLAADYISPNVHRDRDMDACMVVCTEAHCPSQYFAHSSLWHVCDDNSWIKEKTQLIMIDEQVRAPGCR